MMFGASPATQNPAVEDHEKKKQKKKVIAGLTLSKLQKALNEETLLIMIEKISFRVNVSLPKVCWEVEMNQLLIENAPDQSSQPIMILSTDGNDFAELCSIKKFSFKATRNSN